MSTKVNCTKCNVEILPTTAKKTGGLCMPCSSGTREIMEQNKQQWVEEQNIIKNKKTLRKNIKDIIGNSEPLDAKTAYTAIKLMSEMFLEIENKLDLLHEKVNTNTKKLDEILAGTNHVE